MPEAWKAGFVPNSQDESTVELSPGRTDLQENLSVKASTSIGLTREDRIQVKERGLHIADLQRQNGERHAASIYGRMKFEPHKACRAIQHEIFLAFEAIDPRTIQSTADPKIQKEIAVKLALMRAFFEGALDFINRQPIEEGGSFVSAAAEFATLLALYDSSPTSDSKIYKPSRKDDLFHGIDGWMERGDKVAAIQVKSLFFKDIPERRVVAVTSPSHLTDRILDNPQFSGCADFHQEAKRQKFIREGEALLTTCQQYDNVTPAYVILPKNEQGPVDFNPGLGLPSQEMKDTLASEFGFILGGA